MGAQHKIKTFWEGKYLKTVEQNILIVGNEIRAIGYITGTDKDGDILEVHYEINLTSDWKFQNASVFKNNTDTIVISKSGSNWTINDKKRPELYNCEFIDINVTPFTNTIPANRLPFHQNSRQEIQVAFIDVFKNEVTLSNQCYTKQDDSHFIYENMDSGFKRTLQVDSLGIVVNYPGIWKRLNAESKFREVLVTAQASESIGNEKDMYDWLIGSWDAKVIDYKKDGTKITQEGEWHFAWVLEGRAIQDVWIVPGRGNRNTIEEGNRYGTSLRVFNPEKQLWELTWLNPVTGAFDRLEGKEIDGELVYEGTDKEGNLQRWTFKEIKQNSFHWTGELSTDGGKTWKLEAEFFLTRN
ncbi:MAG: putative glycolipid-binding domain-containing protein [Bacteroidales bacterium]